MSSKIRIKVGETVLKAEIFDTDNGKALMRALPFESDINVWGDEFYFKSPIKRPLDETATKVVKIGDIGFWPPDDAVCIFFGPTPASNGPEPVPASEVNIIGRIIDDARVLKKVMEEKKIRLERQQ